jgi:hypothetical protein
VSRADSKAASKLAERLKAAYPEYEFKSFADKEEGQPGYAIQRKGKGELWHDVGWIEGDHVIWRDYFPEGKKHGAAEGFK